MSINHSIYLVIASSYKKDFWDNTSPEDKEGYFTDHPEGHGSVVDTSKCKKVHHALGSNPGGIYEDHKGNHWYVKHSPTSDHAKNEITAHHLYSLGGVKTPSLYLAKTKDGKLGVASPMKHLELFKRGRKEDINNIQKHFATHSWLANWDNIGLEDDNQARDKEGKMNTVDVGGSLLYRAQGSPKGSAWGNKVNEWHNLRDENKNYESGSVYGKMTPSQLKTSAKDVVSIPHYKIKEIVDKFGPGTPKDKENLTNTLIARQNHIKELSGI